MASSASAPLVEPPGWYAMALGAAAEPPPASAPASAEARFGHDDRDPRPASKASYSAAGPAPGPPATGSGRVTLFRMRSRREVVGSPSGCHGQLPPVAHQAKNDWRSA